MSESILITSAQINHFEESEGPPPFDQGALMCDVDPFIKIEPVDPIDGSPVDSDKVGYGQVTASDSDSKINTNCQIDSYNQVPNIESEMPVVTSRDSDENSAHPCLVCGKLLGKKKSLYRHMMVHTGERPYTCSQCGKAFRQSTHLKDHIATHLDQRQHECSICGRTFNRKTNLQQHMVTHSDTKGHFSCDICGKNFKRSDDGRRHMLSHTDERPYACEVCGKTFKQKSHMKGHMGTHTGEKPHKCHICERAFGTSKERIRHLRTHGIHTNARDIHFVENSIIEQGAVPLQVGSGIIVPVREGPSIIVPVQVGSGLTDTGVPMEGTTCFPSPAIHQLSTTISSSFPPLASVDCCQLSTTTGFPPHQFKIKSEVVDSSYDGQEPALPDPVTPVSVKVEPGSVNVDYSFNVEPESITIKIEPEIFIDIAKPFSCTECGKTFKQRNYLTKHMTAHTEERPFRCEVCGKCFKKKYNLTTHLTVHSDDRPFKCDICGRAFKARFRLNEHMTTHVDAKSELGSDEDTSSMS